MDSGESDDERLQALADFRQLLDAEAVERLQPSGDGAVYTTLLTIHLMIYQRLHKGRTLADAVAEVVSPQAAPRQQARS